MASNTKRSSRGPRCFTANSPRRWRPAASTYARSRGRQRGPCLRDLERAGCTAAHAVGTGADRRRFRRHGRADLDGEVGLGEPPVCVDHRRHQQPGARPRLPEQHLHLLHPAQSRLLGGHRARPVHARAVLAGHPSARQFDVRPVGRSGRGSAEQRARRYRRATQQPVKQRSRFRLLAERHDRHR